MLGGARVYSRSSIFTNPCFTFGHSRIESGFDYGFAQAEVNNKTCYYLVYRALIEAMDRPASRCFVEMDARSVRLVEKRWPHEEVHIFTKDIVSYYMFDHGSKFVALCIDARRKEKSGYWFINFDTEKQLTAFCDCLHRLFAMTTERSVDDRISTIRRRGSYRDGSDAETIQIVKCWCCGSRVILPKWVTLTESRDSGFDESQYTGSSPRKMIPTSQPRSYYPTKRKFRYA
ncbi:conserved hypothetical protein [Echinococcus multilocularis]|uniref:DUF5737 domain-containing protein n=1 Tax=Echinococcus multilocularis TaxID=6211 RepID=A0A068YC60_ECHMU|nr:conserved hypothetical protein [Echinococcus multilocularis]